MKKINIVILLQFLLSITAHSQKIFGTGNISVNLDGANGSCTTPGTGQPNVLNISVSGVGTMTATNQLLLASIALSDCGTGSKNLNAVQIRVMSPSGQCFGIYNGGLSTIATGTHYLNLVSSTSCLNVPNTANEPNTGSPFLSNGNNGYYNAQFSGVGTNYSNFTGNADGTWKIIFSENTANPPCVTIARLFFGDPTVINQGTTGDNCSNPIVWNGTSPICGATTSMNGSTQMPGSIGGPNTNTFGTIGGVTCGWNFANNNDVWIKYTATKANTCLSVSGISGTNVALQSIVVTDANTNDLDPCTQLPRIATNDPNWQVVSCPRPAIYGTTAGTQYNQQHCFTSEIGKTYYLVVDGDGGASSKFWVWGFSFNGVLDLKYDTYSNRNNYLQNPIINLSNSGKLSLNLHNNRNTYQSQSIRIFNSAGSLIYTNFQLINNRLELTMLLDRYMCSGLNIVRVELTSRFGVPTNYVFKHNKN